MYVVFLHAHGVGSVHTACLALLDHSCQTNDTNPDFEDRQQPRQKLPSLMAENGNTCTTCAYLSRTHGFFAPFYFASVSALMVSAVQLFVFV